METIAEIFIVFILPVLLWYWKIIPTKYRLRVLHAMNAVALLFVVLKKWNLEKLGIRFDNLYSLLPIYTIFTLIGVVILFFISKTLKRNPSDEFKNKPRYIRRCIEISILQETIYRGYLIPLLTISLGPFMVILANASIFSFVHVIYQNKKIDLPLIFMAGMAFAAIYVFYPNLILISFSHIILNYTAVRFGFFHLSKT